MPEPERNYGAIDAGQQEPDCCRVAEDVRRDSFVGERRALLLCLGSVAIKYILHTISRQSLTPNFDAYLNCGIPLHGCARAYCDKCKHTELIAFSCKRRGLCPSCETKRGLIFAENLQHNVLLPYEQRHIIWSIPKRLRAYFRYDRSLSKYLYRAAWEAWQEYVAELHPSGTPGGVLALHTSGDLLPFHPHLHGIFLAGTVDKHGVFHSIPEINTAKLEVLFSRRVFDALLREGLLRA